MWYYLIKSKADIFHSHIHSQIISQILAAVLSGKRMICGVSMPDGMKEHDKFPTPIITPTTKAQVGHDEDISKEEIINSGLVSKSEYEKLEEYTYKIFERGSKYAKSKNLLLVDTKYEFGKFNGEIILIEAA